MKTLALAKTIVAAVICGTGATLGITLYGSQGSKALWLALGTVLLGFVIAAVPVQGGRPR